MPDAATTPPPAPPKGPREVLDEIRAEVAAGTPLTGDLLTRFHRAVHALDPAATEDGDPKPALWSLPASTSTTRS